MIPRPARPFRFKVMLFMLPLLLPIGGAGIDADPDRTVRVFRPDTGAVGSLGVTALPTDGAGESLRATASGDSFE